MKQQNIHTLVARFLDGETTLEEERKLYAFFQRDDVPEELKEYQEMFRAYAAIVPQTEKKRVMRPIWWRVASVAAVLLVMCLIGLYIIYNNTFTKPHGEVLVAKTEKLAPKEEPKRVAEVKRRMAEEVKAEVKTEGERNEMENMGEPEEATEEEGVEKDEEVEEKVETKPTVMYASHEEQEDTTSLAPGRMDEFIGKFAVYHQVKPVDLDCAVPLDSATAVAIYVFPDKKEMDVFGKLLQLAVLYDHAMPGYHLGVSRQQFFFGVNDEKEGLQYSWLAERTGGRILLYCAHSPIGVPVSSECYQEYRNRCILHTINTGYHQL